jgi:hypothetical protein
MNWKVPDELGVAVPRVCQFVACGSVTNWTWQVRPRMSWPVMALEPWASGIGQGRRAAVVARTVVHSSAGARNRIPASPRSARRGATSPVQTYLDLRQIKGRGE